MVRPQLNQITQDWNARNLWDTLDLGNVRRVQKPDQRVQDDDGGEVED